MREQLKIVIEKLNRISESPYLHDIELFHFETAVISKSALVRSYTYIGAVLSEIQIYEKNDWSAFVVGVVDDSGNLIHFLDIQLDHKLYPVEPTQLRPNYRQIGMTMISKNIAQQGITKAVYQYLVERFDMVSDRVQYLGGKRLWQSLAKNSIANIYVFDGGVNDYIRDSGGNIVKYDGVNIDESVIWGETMAHQNRILVASQLEKK
jgi:hypothetical protein